ncbi:hypothetical protein BDU57DRAFT_516825 [Ampelomyces quisqualis]|uniref:Zn(2)-C6 fungal-type domain-containing protein n=1 Tax=Ampelomyces quisqualis TaxID=50730 RepID=A0A6A5QPZ9_AMPQU|nr:hypothetical protein BDU57DRAFT_516825 [Ampelomyces quisqualis]
MSDAELAKNDPVASVSRAVPRKRSRKGCLTCRTRRRKCDEKRPICQNCTDKKLECRYPALFQFLGKNSYTLDAEKGGRFGNLKFASDNGENPVVGAVRNREILPVMQGDAVAAHTQEHAAENCPRSLELQNVASCMPSPNSYEFALYGLMALSSASTEHGATLALTAGEDHPEDVNLNRSTDNFTLESDPLDDEPTFESDSTHHVWQDQNGRHAKPSQIPENGTAATAALDYVNFPMESVEQHMLDNPPENSGSELASCGRDAYSPSVQNLTMSAGPRVTQAEEELSLLRNYRYRIAPWLDMCDIHQTFGVKVLMLSVKSDLVRERILKVSKTVHTEDLPSTPQVETVTQDILWSESSQEASQGAISSVLRLVEDVVGDLIRFWEAEEIDQRGKLILEVLLSNLDKGSLLVTSPYWLALRLELSCGIMATHPIYLPLPFLASSGMQTAADYDITNRIAITLCSEAVMFSHEDDSRWLQQRHGLNRVEVWNMLIHEFGAWFKNRPLEYQPIIELYSKDGIQSEHDFPTIVFTNGAAILANSLFHLGMLLLLQHKPRIRGRIGSNSSSMSKLWHGHRICGIAIQNDQPTTWDPSLLASLIVAARTVTHRSQQAIIVQTLKKVQDLTRWNISGSIEDLTREWRLGDGW